MDASWVNIPSTETDSYSGSAAWMGQDKRRVRHVVVVDFVMWHDPAFPY